MKKKQTIDQISTQTSWITEIEAYCGEIGILPNDLIETHRLSLKPAKMGKKEGKESKITEKQKQEFKNKINNHES